MTVPQRRQLADEGDQRLSLCLDRPIHPTDVAILAVGVVVTLLRASEFVARQQHRRALRQQQSGEYVADLALTLCIDVGIVSGPLGAHVPGAVVGAAVLAVLAVGLVVLL